MDRMMGEIIVLNGPAGVGKTAVAAHLAARRPGTVCVSGDILRGFAPADARAHLGPGSTYRAGAALADIYLAMGALRVIFEYVFETPTHVERFRAAAPAGIPLYLITLWASLDVVQAREAARATMNGRPALGPRVPECHAAFASNLPGLATLGRVLDAATSTPEELAAEIDALVRVAAPASPCS